MHAKGPLKVRKSIPAICGLREEPGGAAGTCEICWLTGFVGRERVRESWMMRSGCFVKVDLESDENGDEWGR